MSTVLETDFVEQPRDVMAQVGSEAKLVCDPPEGKPNPWVSGGEAGLKYWVKGLGGRV